MIILFKKTDMNDMGKRKIIQKVNTTPMSTPTPHSQQGKIKEEKLLIQKKVVDSRLKRAQTHAESPKTFRSAAERRTNDCINCFLVHHNNTPSQPSSTSPI